MVIKLVNTISTLAEKIEHLLWVKKWNQEKLGEILGISQQSVSNLAGGDTKSLKTKHIETLAKHGISQGWLTSIKPVNKDDWESPAYITEEPTVQYGTEPELDDAAVMKRFNKQIDMFMAYNKIDTLKACSEILGFEDRYMTVFFNEHRTPSVAILAAMAKAGMNINYTLTGHGPEMIQKSGDENMALKKEIVTLNKLIATQEKLIDKLNN